LILKANELDKELFSYKSALCDGEESIRLSTKSIISWAIVPFDPKELEFLRSVLSW